MNNTYITEKPSFAALHALACDAEELTTLVSALADNEDSEVAAEQLYEAAVCFLNSVRNVVFADE
jgi:hypothetical protein